MGNDEFEDDKEETVPRVRQRESLCIKGKTLKVLYYLLKATFSIE